MQTLSLPHQAPIRFAQQILERHEERARVSVVFEQIPSLGMIIESAAQASAVFAEEASQGAGFLVSLKNIQKLSTPKSKTLEIELTQENTLGNMSSFSFVAFDKSQEIVTGVFVIAKA